MVTFREYVAGEILSREKATFKSCPSDDTDTSFVSFSNDFMKFLTQDTID